MSLAGTASQNPLSQQELSRHGLWIPGVRVKGIPLCWALHSGPATLGNRCRCVRARGQARPRPAGGRGDKAAPNPTGLGKLGHNHVWSAAKRQGSVQVVPSLIR